MTECRRCPRLVEWRERVAREKRAAYTGESYWGRPVPGFGDAGARVLLLGLAPAAHGGNRTGRVFTGDRSGDFLFEALHRTGFANQPTSTHPGDGLELRGAFVAAAVRCAPPANRPLPDERDNCLPYAAGELRLMPAVRVVACLGSYAWDAALRVEAMLEGGRITPKPRFGHGAEHELAERTRPARHLPPEPAEHVHGHADAGDARRRASAGARAGGPLAGGPGGRGARAPVLLRVPCRGRHRRRI